MVNEIILFEAHDKSITLPVHLEQETVWLNRNQMAELYGRDVKTIGKHISNALKEELEPSTVAKFATVQRQYRKYISVICRSGTISKSCGESSKPPIFYNEKS